MTPEPPQRSSPDRVRRLLATATATLADAGVPSPDHDARVLLASVLGRSRGELPLVREVDEAQAAGFERLVARRAGREPLQHLTGVAPFRHAELAVGPGVFVPRPETEVLAGWAVGLARRMAHDPAHDPAGRAPVVVDLCTGSGAVAHAVATEVPAARVHAVELGEEALAFAARNLEGTGVDLRAGDMADAFPDLDGAVDIVLGNPPYIPLAAWESVAPEVRDHDPALALWSGEDGLDAIRVVEATAARLLRPGGGWAGVEHADIQGEAAVAVFASAGRWSQVRDHPDLTGRPRFVTARLAR